NGRARSPAKEPDLKLPSIGDLVKGLPGPSIPPKKSDDPAPPKSAESPKSPEPTPPAPAADPGPTGDGQIPAALLAKLKAATVFVKGEGGSIAWSGSGFVLKVDGDKALIVTNQHVAQPKTKEGM